MVYSILYPDELVLTDFEDSCWDALSGFGKILWEQRPTHLAKQVA
jgi:hypothetical protein